MINEKALAPHLRKMYRSVENPLHGFYGPDSLFWKIGRERVILLGGMSAVLLQIAHPHVGEGVNTHSNFTSDPIGRFQRTFDVVYHIVFGTAEEAIIAANSAYQIHKKVKGALSENIPPRHKKGDRYDANRADLLLWVHSTLVDQSLLGYKLFVGHMTDRQKEEYYEESKTFARLFSIPDKHIPETLADFYEYYNDMIENVLAVGKTGMMMRNKLFFLFPYSIGLPVSYTMAAGMLPERVRKMFGIHWDPVMQLAFHRLCRRVKQIRPFLPSQLRFEPNYLKAAKRLRDAEHANISASAA